MLLPTAEVTELSPEGWEDQSVGRIEARAVKACRVAFNAGTFEARDIIIVDRKARRGATLFVVRCADRLLRIVIEESTARVRSSDKMDRIEPEG
jgi:hypothetical protein